LDWAGQIASGTILTVGLAFATLPVGLLLGLLLALASGSRNLGLRSFAAVYSTVFRGLPELLTLILIYYGAQELLNRAADHVGVDGFGEISPFAAGVFSLALVFAAFSAEVFRSALNSIPSGQAEAAQVVGLNRFQAFRDVIAPQMLRAAMPGLSNTWIVLLKDTSLVSIIALDDLMRTTGLAVSSTKQPFEFYGIACIIYLLLTTVSERAAGIIETRLSRGYSRSAS
jgi:His/Glu/Gln/Arg/opine family amino acid ABC transporter permease subunit